MSTIKTGVVAHDSAVNAAEGVRQTAVAAAGNNQALVRTAEITFYRSVAASCRANNNLSGIEQANNALRELGTWS
jgi:hypothetical protein